MFLLLLGRRSCNNDYNFATGLVDAEMFEHFGYCAAAVLFVDLGNFAGD